MTCKRWSWIQMLGTYSVKIERRSSNEVQPRQSPPTNSQASNSASTHPDTHSSESLLSKTISSFLIGPEWFPDEGGNGLHIWLILLHRCSNCAFRRPFSKLLLLKISLTHSTYRRYLTLMLLLGRTLIMNDVQSSEELRKVMMQWISQHQHGTGPALIIYNPATTSQL